jgi:FkbM family methyltransferase
MNYGPQYNERDVLERFFEKKTGGLLVEVGAADGTDNSHTAFLIDEYNWTAVLIEPHPQYFHVLSEHYALCDRVYLVNKAIHKEEGLHDFYLSGQISRLDYIKSAPKVRVDCVRLDNLLKSLKIDRIDFLSVDAEGMDLVVLDTFDWDEWRPALVCVEHSMGRDELKTYMHKHDYKFVEDNIGNSFFADGRN